MNKLIILSGLLIAVGMCEASTPPFVGGQIVTDGFVSNFVSRSPDGPPGDPRRLFNVYLPPQYFTDLTATFPIVYHLTGFEGNYKTYSETDKQVMDEMLQANQVVPMIIVAPDPRVLLYTSNFWVDSEFNGQIGTGLFEQYIVKELIPYVDAKYRQKRSPSGDARFFRALMGQSMGGFGSLFYGIKHNELFTAYAGDSATAFWLINTNRASPEGDPTWRLMYTFNKLIMPELQDGALNPEEIATDGFLAWAASFSPNSTRPLKVDFPFVVDDATNKPQIIETSSGPSFVPVPEILSRWETFDPYVLLDTADKEVIRRQAIYLDAGDDVVGEIIDNVGAHYLSLKLSELNIKNEYILFKGGHTSCTTSREIECYRFRTNLQTFSAKFSENGLYSDDIRAKITGTMTIELQDNAVWNISNKRLVGIETDPANGISTTNVTLSLKDSAKLAIGTATTLGGGLQVGNPFGKATFVFDPSLINHRVSFTLSIDGPQATAQIGKQGYLGFGVGIDGNQTAVPNYWGVSSLTNLALVTLNFSQGKFFHNQIASSITEPASLLAVGGDPRSRYSFSFSPRTFTNAGGGNLAKIVDTSLMHPTVLDTVGSIDQGGIRNREVIVPDPNQLFDEFYGPPNGIMGSETFYTNKLQVSIFGSGPMLADARKRRLPASATLNQFFAHIQAEPYREQATKSAAFSVINGNPTIGFLPTATTIERDAVSTTDLCTPLSPSLDLQNVASQGAIGIKRALIDGQEVTLRLYDLDPPE